MDGVLQLNQRNAEVAQCIEHCLLALYRVIELGRFFETEVFNFSFLKHLIELLNTLAKPGSTCLVCCSKCGEVFLNSHEKIYPRFWINAGL
ncbi:hypothetical protein DIE16_13375 [Burkholderia sp. Bp9090]|nr:hypothetical protein DIE16_13375 [Burkholderia sp. Bp9090]